MAKGGDGIHPPTGFSNFSQKWEELFCKLNFTCRLVFGTSVHEKSFQIGPTVLALKLDKERVLGGGGGWHTPLSKSSPIFLTMKMTSNHDKFWHEVR